MTYSQGAMMTLDDKEAWLKHHGFEVSGGYNATGGIYHIMWVPNYINMEFTGYGLTPETVTEDLYDTVKKRLFNRCNVISCRKASGADNELRVYKR